MQLHIESATEYRYAFAPRRSTQYLRLTPSDGPGQTVLDWRLSAPGRLAPWTDMFGNRCHSLFLDEPAPVLRIGIVGVVETTEVAGIQPDTANDLPLAAYLRASDYARPGKPLRDYADAWRDQAGRDRLDALHDAMTAIHRDVAYDEDASTVLTTADQAFAEGRGVCQDHAHIMIAVARRLAVPARYVSGYLWTGAHGQTYSASHAWAECWVDGLGWVSFDAANNSSATEGYVRIAVGFDYGTASPVRGVRVGGGAEDMHVEVRLFDGKSAAAPGQSQQ